MLLQELLAESYQLEAADLAIGSPLRRRPMERLGDLAHRRLWQRRRIRQLQRQLSCGVSLRETAQPCRWDKLDEHRRPGGSWRRRRQLWCRMGPWRS